MVVGVGILDDWRFCPRCGGSLTALDGRVRCEQGHDHWANPVPGSQALVERDGRVLLGRRLTWIARAAGGVERPGDDLVELRWFGPDELPAPDELAFESFVEILSLWRTRHQHA